MVLVIYINFACYITDCLSPTLFLIVTVTLISAFQSFGANWYFNARVDQMMQRIWLCTRFTKRRWNFINLEQQVHKNVLFVFIFIATLLNLSLLRERWHLKWLLNSGNKISYYTAAQLLVPGIGIFSVTVCILISFMHQTYSNEKGLFPLKVYFW